MRIILASLFFLTFNFTFSQPSPDTLEENNTRPWQGFILDIGCSNVKQSGNYFQDFPKLSTWGSKSVNLYFFIGIPMGKKFTLAPGIGLGMDGYMANSSSTRFNFSNDSLTFFHDINGIQNKKSKLAVNHFDIPLELRFKSGKKLSNTFRLAVGIKGGIAFNTHSKIKYKRDSDGESIKEKMTDDFAINRFRYGLTGRIGFGYINAFAYCSLSHLFKDGKAPEVTPYTFGISISPNYFFNL